MALMNHLTLLNGYRFLYMFQHKNEVVLAGPSSSTQRCPFTQHKLDRCILVYQKKSFFSNPSPARRLMTSSPGRLRSHKRAYQGS